MDKQDLKHFKKSFKEDWFGWLIQFLMVVMIFGVLGFCIYSQFTNPQQVNISEEDATEIIMSNTVF